MDAVHPISAFSWRATIFLALVLLTPVLITGFATKAVGGARVVPMALISGVLVLPVFIFLFVQLFLINAKITHGSLKVGGGLYAITVPAKDIEIGQARALEEKEIPSLGFRTNGIGMPGLSFGWFKSRNKKFFAAITSRTRVVLIPTKLGYDILLSPNDPEAFVRDLRTLPAQ